MDFFELFQSGNLLWGVFLIIAVGFLLSSFGRYRRSGSTDDLPRVLTDTLATLMVAGAALHLGFGLPHPTPLLVVYGLILGGLFVYRMKVVSDLQTETEAKSQALAEANRAREAAEANRAREAAEASPTRDTAEAGHTREAAGPSGVTGPSGDSPQRTGEADAAPQAPERDRS
ncbi:MAG: hypothetical protein EA422_11630 [Gemmatimonadales bacterium]|nr:MAG: hypothetical protein EA422_11630 [Gemmatimonadales bacterium]